MHRGHLEDAATVIGSDFVLRIAWDERRRLQDPSRDEALSCATERHTDA
ncbi:hypothetical protein [Streptomyces sp. NPDC047108]